MKYRKTALLLVFSLILGMFAFVSFVPSVMAYTISVDGNPADWLADASAQAVNTGKWYTPGALPYTGEYVWKDQLGDDTGNSSYVYPTDFNGDEADLMELRITWDLSYLYLCIKMATVQDWNRTAISLLIDQDRDGTGTDWYTEYSDMQVVPEARWEWGLSIAGPNKVGLWSEGFGTMYTQANGLLFANSTVAGYLTFEVGLPTSLIGIPDGKTWRFSAITGCQSPANPWGGDVFAEVFDVAGVGTPGGGDTGWEDADAFDMAFAPSHAAQRANLGNFTIGAGSAGVVKTIYYADVTFVNQMGEIFISYGQNAGLNPPGWTYCTPIDTHINATALGLGVGSQFTAQIYINNITNFWGWGVDVMWETAYLDLLSYTFNWTWYGNPPPTPSPLAFPPTIFHTDPTNPGWGNATGAGASLTLPNPPIAGSGAIADLVFNITGNTPAGYLSPIRISCLVTLSDPAGKLIIVKETNGLFSNYIPPIPTPCDARIRENATIITVGETIHIESVSLDAYNGTHTIPITREDWNITDSLGVNVFSASMGRHSSFDWTPTYDDTYTVLLEIWCVEAVPTLPPGFEYDNATATKTVLPVVETGIDCFTNKDRFCGYNASQVGFGPNMPADAYTFDELVTLYAYVIYNGWPMAGRLVSFEVYGPTGLWLVKTNITNDNGIAWIRFRIPTPGKSLNFSDVAGKWRCFQKVRMSDEYFNDTVMWDVGWIVELIKVVPYGFDGVAWVPVTGYTYPEHMAFKIYYKNIALGPRLVFFSILVYDDEDVPIAEFIFAEWVEGAWDFCDPWYEAVLVICLEIPDWFYPGTGKVHVSAWFNALPGECGHPTSPEVSETFVLLAPEVPPPDP